LRIGAAFLAVLMVLTAGLAAAAAGSPRPGVELAQSRAADERRREDERKRSLREEREERRESQEREQRERDRRWSEERRERQDKATEELRERREQEIQDRYRRMEEGYETEEERRQRQRRERRLHTDTDFLRRLFPPEWIPGILAGRVETGWNANAVIASVGRPESITRRDADTEVWHYPTREVVLSKGKVTAVGPAPAKPRPGG
jgi:hypothetical protein